MACLEMACLEMACRDMALQGHGLAGTWLCWDMALPGHVLPGHGFHISSISKGRSHDDSFIYTHLLRCIFFCSNTCQIDRIRLDLSPSNMDPCWALLTDTTHEYYSHISVTGEDSGDSVFIISTYIYLLRRINFCISAYSFYSLSLLMNSRG